MAAVAVVMMALMYKWRFFRTSSPLPWLLLLLLLLPRTSSQLPVDTLRLGG
jgi:hypothetical protein